MHSTRLPGFSGAVLYSGAYVLFFVCKLMPCYDDLGPICRPLFAYGDRPPSSLAVAFVLSCAALVLLNHFRATELQLWFDPAGTYLNLLGFEAPNLWEPSLLGSKSS